MINQLWRDFWSAEVVAEIEFTGCIKFINETTGLRTKGVLRSIEVDVPAYGGVYQD
jgi:hypothetical protein